LPVRLVTRLNLGDGVYFTMLPRGFIQRQRINCLQMIFRLHRKGAKTSPGTTSLNPRLPGIFLALVFEPRPAATVPYKLSKTLIERNIAVHPDFAMAHFMQQQIGKIRLRPEDEGAQQRVFEPT